MPRREKLSLNANIDSEDDDEDISNPSEDQCFCFKSFAALLTSLKEFFSEFKLVWKESLFYFLIQAVLTSVYTYALTKKEDKEIYEVLSQEVGKNINAMPCAFLLGFLVQSAVGRRSELKKNMPAIYRLVATFLNSLRLTDDPNAAALLDHYSRRVLLMWLLAFHPVSQTLASHYPNLTEMQRAGFLLDSERRALEPCRPRTPPSSVKKSRPKPFRKDATLIVFDWLHEMVHGQQAKAYFARDSDPATNTEKLFQFRTSCWRITNYASMNMPGFVYRSVTVILYCYGILSILGHTVNSKGIILTIFTGYIPIHYALPYLFYYLWLKLSRIGNEPFKNDEDDAELHRLFKRHIKTVIKLRKVYQQRIANAAATSPMRE